MEVVGIWEEEPRGSSSRTIFFSPPGSGNRHRSTRLQPGGVGVGENAHLSLIHDLRCGYGIHI